MGNLKEKEIKMYDRAHRFLQMQDIDDLAGVTGIRSGLILKAIEGSDKGYYAFKIPKRTGGSREIEAPESSLKLIQGRINYLLGVIYHGMRPACVHGFVKSVPGQGASFSIASNASAHVGKQYVFNIDLKDFFHAIDIRSVKRVFRSYPFFFGNDLASFLAILSTYRGRLPMGAPTSPVVSNLACFLFDRSMMRFAEEQGLAFTRYADDLTFSSDKRITESMMLGIRDVITEYRLKLNEVKTRLQTGGGRQTVTGLKVNEKVNVDRKYIRSIRAMLHNWRKGGISGASLPNANPDEFYNILKGKIDFLKMVRGEEDRIYNKLKTDFNALSSGIKSPV